MHAVEPKVFLIGESKVVSEGLTQYLEHIGAGDWTSDASSDPEKIIEVMGRLCYRSFKPGLNPNVTRVREHNADYIRNIVEVRHGSVIEHPVVNLIFADVSRVFTHELVRHRVGVAYEDLSINEVASPGAVSEQSLRFVRLEDLGLWMPTVVIEDEEVMHIFAETFENLETLQVKLAEHYGLDNEGVKFHLKKVVTSALRRIAPMGLATSIGWSANLRTIRWLLENRTHPSAEEEIRLVFGKVAEIVVPRYKNLFADFSVETVDGLPWYKPQYSKV